MTFYVVRRVGVGIFLLFLMSAMFFALTRVTPGQPFSVGENPRVHQDQVNRRLHRLGLTDENGTPYPIPQQYVLYLGALVHGDLGDSYVYNISVTTLLKQRLPNTALLLGTALVVALLIGIPLGIYASTHQYSKLDMTTSIVSYVGVSIPSFVLGIYLLLVFAVFLKQSPLHWGFPLFGMHTGGVDDPLDLLYHMVLPVTSLTILEIAIFSRFMRASMLEVLHQDYIRTARAKGLAVDKVNYKHALRNAILPIITLVAIAIPQIVNGAIITEGIFSWPGTGQLAFQAVLDRDYPVILGVVMLVAALTVIFNLLADVTYAVADPRIRY
ncbi:MAG TPA: ABC transporter permease [Candidatus Dormibacteraeota bacterium]